MGKQRGQYVGSALLRERILELTLQGNSIRAIAAVVGKSPARVHQVLSAAIDELRAQNAKTTEQIVEIQVAQLDALVLSHWESRAEPEHAAVILKTMERRAKLAGLDQPDKSELFGKGGAPLVPPVFNIGFSNGGPGRTGNTGTEGS